MKQIIKQLLPPIIIDAGRLVTQKNKYGWLGNYSSWGEALKKCTGYNQAIIFEKVKHATKEVKNNRAAFERDSVLFFEEMYNWPLISFLLLTASKNNGILRVIDFGGALGSIYFQHKKLLSQLPGLLWCVVEQDEFVNIGKQEFENEQIKFSKSIDECQQLYGRFNVILLGSVLQYMEKPYGLIDYLNSFNIESVLVDRTPLFDNYNDRITVQTVPPEIYEASYPSWLLNKEKVIASFSKVYTKLIEYENPFKTNVKDCKFVGLGFTLQKK